MKGSAHQQLRPSRNAWPLSWSRIVQVQTVIHTSPILSGFGRGFESDLNLDSINQSLTARMSVGYYSFADRAALAHFANRGASVCVREIRRQTSEVGAGSANAARTVLCGGRVVRVRPYGDRVSSGVFRGARWRRGASRCRCCWRLLARGRGSCCPLDSCLGGLALGSGSGRSRWSGR